MWVKMKQDCDGSPDGAKVEHFKEGDKHNVPERLRDVFVEGGLAEDTTAPKAKKEKKDNKAKAGAPKDKGD